MCDVSMGSGVHCSALDLGMCGHSGRSWESSFVEAMEGMSRTSMFVPSRSLIGVPPSSVAVAWETLLLRGGIGM